MALKQSPFGRVLLFALVLIAQSAPAQISAWKLGGAGLSWSEGDTTRLFIDFVSAPSSIQPIYLTPEKTVFSHLDNWVFWRDPSDIVLGYVDGETPRTWKWSDGLAAPSGSLLIDGDDATYYPPRAVPLEREVYTMDLAVAVPAIFLRLYYPQPRLSLRRHTPQDRRNSRLRRVDCQRIRAARRRRHAGASLTYHRRCRRKFRAPRRDPLPPPLRALRALSAAGLGSRRGLSRLFRPRPIPGRPTWHHCRV